MYFINTILKRIYSTGVALDISILDTIRKRITNLILATIIILSSLLLFYRMYLGDWDAVVVNALVVSSNLFLFYLCTKGKHELVLLLFTILIISLTINLNNTGLHISSIIYYALIPIGMALLFKNRSIKHLVYFTCMICFFLTMNARAYDLNIYITFVAVTSIFYFAILNFIHFVELKQDEINQVLKEREKAIVELKARNISLQQFSYICSHDFKEPVHVIGKYSGLIQKKMSSVQLKETYGTYFKFIDSSVIKLFNLVEALQVFTDVNIRNQLQIEKLSLNDLFNKSLIKLSRLIEEKKAKVVFNNKSGKDYIYGSQYGLELVIGNLIENGLQFNEADQPNIVVTLERKEENLLLQVEDNGIGVEEQYLQYIFEPFKTMNNRRFHNSSGLGLAICKEIINKIEGEIWVESSFGYGSTFFVRFKDSSFI